MHLEEKLSLNLTLAACLARHSFKLFLYVKFVPIEMDVLCRKTTELGTLNLNWNTPKTG